MSNFALFTRSVLIAGAVGATLNVVGVVLIECTHKKLKKIKAEIEAAK